jgi:hypothetical protein
VNGAVIHVELDPGPDYLILEDEIFVVVDNRDCAITPNDAVPTGLVQATLEVDWLTEDQYMVFPEMGTCLIGLVIILVIILALIFLVYRSTKARRERESMMYQQYPPVQPMYLQPPPAQPQEPPTEETLDPRIKNGDGE